jgi:hypothetical protein
MRLNRRRACSAECSLRRCNAAPCAARGPARRSTAARPLLSPLAARHAPRRGLAARSCRAQTEPRPAGRPRRQAAIIQPSAFPAAAFFHRRNPACWNRRAAAAAPSDAPMPAPAPAPSTSPLPRIRGIGGARARANPHSPRVARAPPLKSHRKLEPPWAPPSIPSAPNVDRPAARWPRHVRAGRALRPALCFSPSGPRRMAQSRVSPHNTGRTARLSRPPAARRRSLATRACGLLSVPPPPPPPQRAPA